jgi:hypothetical protein
MNIRIEPANWALFEFEDSMYMLEEAYAEMHRQFDLMMLRYHNMQQAGASDRELLSVRERLLRAHMRMRRQAVNLHDVHQEHLTLLHVVERYLTLQEMNGGINRGSR